MKIYPNPLKLASIDYPIHPLTRDQPILIDQYGLVLNGHHRFLSNEQHGTDNAIEQLELSDLLNIPVDKLVYHATKNGSHSAFPLDQTGWVVVQQENGLYRVEVGKNAIERMLETGVDHIQARVILE